MADGTTKPIEQIQPGDLVLSAPEHNPEAPVEAKPVVEVYHNKPSRLLNLHIDETVIRCTLNHPFYVREKGWTQASDLAIGAQLRTHDGEWVEVTNRSVSDDIQPVFNLQVNDHHTYHVGDLSGGRFVLVHNESPGSVSEQRTQRDQRLHAQIEMIYQAIPEDQRPNNVPYEMDELIGHLDSPAAPIVQGSGNTLWQEWLSLDRVSTQGIAKSLIAHGLPFVRDVDLNKLAELEKQGWQPAQRPSPEGEISTIDRFQEAASWFGLVPGLGDVIDVGNAVVYAARGKWEEAAWSAGAALPVAGSWVGGLKKGKTLARLIDKLEGASDLTKRFRGSVDDVSKAMQTTLEGVRRIDKGVPGKYILESDYKALTGTLNIGNMTVLGQYKKSGHGYRMVREALNEAGPGLKRVTGHLNDDNLTVFKKVLTELGEGKELEALGKTPIGKQLAVNGVFPTKVSQQGKKWVFEFTKTP